VDYFGRILDDITDLWNEIDQSPHAVEAKPVLKSLEKAMVAAVRLEQQRMKRYRAAIRTAGGHSPSNTTAGSTSRPSHP
jgi:hypothetical protein